MKTTHHLTHQHRNARGKKKQLGQFSIELALTIAIGAIVLAGIIYYVTKGRHNEEVNTEASNLTTMIGGAQKLYGSDPTAFASVTAAALINNGVVPSSEVNGTAITSSFGTPITVAPATLYTANDAISFTYGVPPGLCSDFVTSSAGNLAKITVGGTTVLDSTASKPLNEAALGTACSGSAGANVAVVATATR